MDQEAAVSGNKNLKSLSLKLPEAILSVSGIRHQASGIRHQASGNYTHLLNNRVKYPTGHIIFSFFAVIITLKEFYSLYFLVIGRKPAFTYYTPPVRAGNSSG